MWLKIRSSLTTVLRLPSPPEDAFRSKPGTYSYFKLLGTWKPEGRSSISMSPNFVFEALPMVLVTKPMVSNAI